MEFTTTPNTGYQVDTWSVDGVPVQTGGTSYILTNIQADHTVEVTFTMEVPGEEGCSPGYWKNSPDCWECVSPDDFVDDTFPVDMELPPELGELGDDTLMEALNYKGGKGLAGAGRNLLRQAVAALLNSCDPDIANPLSVDEVKDLVRVHVETLDRDEMLDLKDMFDMLNNFGCPLAAHCRSHHKLKTKTER